MSDKRFNRVGGYVYDGEKCISHFEDVKHRDDIVTLLNELHEENQSLKFQLDECQNHKLFSRRELEKENEHIKQTIKTMIETERTELGKSILKQLWEQIQ